MLKTALAAGAVVVVAGSATLWASSMFPTQTIAPEAPASTVSIDELQLHVDPMKLPVQHIQDFTFVYD
jgi:hypothetical protein